MAPKKRKSVSKSGVKKPKRITIETKKEIITKHENGVRVSDLAKQYDMAKSTICTILKKKDALKTVDVAKGVTKLSKRRSQVLEEVEKLLFVWINEKQLAGDSVSEALICERALLLHDDLVAKTPNTSDTSVVEFKASRGWFEKFRRRSGIHSVKHGEAASSDKNAADVYVEEFAKFINCEGYIPHQVFNCNETGLFWKKMPRRTYITQEEKSLAGHKPMKDRLTLLLCANASGDCKIKPLLVYHSENPRVFKRNNVLKGKLPVFWRANSKAWVTRLLFMEWLTEVFAPTVKKYLKENNLPLKCVLIMDNAAGHPPNMEEDLDVEYDFIKVIFLPPNTTPVNQLMDQQVISNFKQLYTRALFSKCFQVTNDTNLTLRDFWKDHLNILQCIYLIDKAWNNVSNRTLQSAWRRLWPDCVPHSDFEETAETLVHEIVTIGMSLGLEVNDEDVVELVEDHRQELNAEELVELQREQMKIMQEEPSEEDEEELVHVSSAEIKDIFTKWNEVQVFIEKHHPNKTVSSRAVDSLNDNVMSHFRKIILQRKRQMSLDRYCVTEPAIEPLSRIQTREKIPELPTQLLEVIMKWDSPSNE